MRVIVRFRFLFILLVFIPLIGCGLMTKETKIQYPNKVSSEMKAEYDQAEDAFKAKRYADAEAAYQAYKQHYPYNALTDMSDFRIGQIYMLRVQYAQASQVFAQLIQKTPDPAIASRARVKAGICQYRLGNPQKALEFFDKAEAQYVQDNDRIKLGSLALAALSKSGGSVEQKAYYDAVLLDSYGEESDANLQKTYGSESPSRQVVIQGLDEWAKKTTNINQIDGRFRNYNATKSAQYIDYKLGMAYYAAGNTKLAKKYLGDLVSQMPNSPFAANAKKTLDQLGYKPEKKGREGGGQVYKIGVILPLSGKYTTFGTNTLNGMLCAASAKPGCTGANNIQLVTRDDQGDPAKATQAVEDLVNQEQVMAIVGPLSSASAEAAARKAQELGVVMISLAQKEGIPDIGTNIFRFSLTPEEQVKALLNFAAKKKNKKFFGVLAPNSNYGKVFLSAFQKMAPEYGAQVTASQSYANTSDAANELRQLKFSVAKASPQMPLGFESLFIPDSYNSILKIAPFLKNAGLDGILILGTNAWDDPSLAKNSGGSLGDAVFLDIYFQNSSNPAVKKFVTEYMNTFGQAPSTLEAMGYDSVRFIGEALDHRKVSNSGDVYRAVISMSHYQGVTGLRSFSATREAQVEPYLLMIDGDKIKEVE